MRQLWATIVAPVVLTACATPEPQWSPHGPLTVPAQATYRACVVTSMGSLTRTTHQDPALQVATVAEGQCPREREALRAALIQDNPGSRWSRDQAEVYVQEYRKVLIAKLAGDHLRSP